MSPYRRQPTSERGGSHPPEQEITRRRFTALAGATMAAGLIPSGAQAFAAGGGGFKARPQSWRIPRPPHLPAGFTRTFSSRFVNAGGLRQHVVTGGKGPPLLLVHGWPESWYAWRHVMPALARDFEVIAVDQRGIGLSDKPRSGYDTRTIANDLVALMDALGHTRFAVVGHDTGFVISYALAADHSDRVDRAALLEIPGPPLRSPAPTVFERAPLNNKVWHLAVNRLEEVNERLIRGREDVYFGYELDIQAGTKKLPAEVVDYYVRLVSTPEALRGSLAFYRALDDTIDQNEQRKLRPLTMPILAIGGETSFGPLVGDAMGHLAGNVESVVIPGAGHWLPEEAPDRLLSAMKPFLAGYRDAAR